jgi:hypothetical protein
VAREEGCAPNEAISTAPNEAIGKMGKAPNEAKDPFSGAERSHWQDG